MVYTNISLAFVRSFDAEIVVDSKKDCFCLTSIKFDGSNFSFHRNRKNRRNTITIILIFGLGQNKELEITSKNSAQLRIGSPDATQAFSLSRSSSDPIFVKF